MKQLVKSFAVIALTIGSATFSYAQKIGHIAIDSLITSMPETKVAEEVAQKYLKELESHMMGMQTELESKYNDYKEKEATMTEAVKEAKQKEMEDLQTRMGQFKASAQEDYQRKYQELSKPIYDKARKAVELVAKEGGYKYVMDTSAGNVVYADPADDLLSLTKKKIATMPAAVIPGTNSTPKTPGMTPKTQTPPKTGGK